MWYNLKNRDGRYCCNGVGQAVQAAVAFLTCPLPRPDRPDERQVNHVG